MNILLAEDNPINQEVALGLLEALDCAVTVVENGKEAVDAARGGRFDLVLMDCQMPVMDGFEAARAIRDAPASDGKPPIVALTASDFDDTKSTCLAAGMDDLLGKPFTRQQLASLLERWRPAATSPVSIGPASTGPASTGPATIAKSSSSLDLTPIDSLRSLDPDGERQLLHRAITKFIEYSDDLVARLGDAVGKGDAAEISRMVHSLKSSSANLGAIDLSRQCAEIESLTAGGGIPEDVDRRLAALQTAHRQARRDLHALLNPDG